MVNPLDYLPTLPELKALYKRDLRIKCAWGEIHAHREVKAKLKACAEWQSEDRLKEIIGGIRGENIKQVGAADTAALHDTALGRNNFKVSFYRWSLTEVSTKVTFETSFQLSKTPSISSDADDERSKH